MLEKELNFNMKKNNAKRCSKNLEKIWGRNINHNLYLIQRLLHEVFKTEREKEEFFKKIGCEGIELGNTPEMAVFLYEVARIRYE